MPKDVRVWEIGAEDQLDEMRLARLDFENRIESWLEQDISIIADNLLVIGRQVGTDFGGVIDLLCVDDNGDVVIVELKRDKTPRDITAQVLDYASWISDLSGERVVELADRYLGGQGSFEQAFEQQFQEELPETLNDHHSMLVVASEIDASTERILNYLSDTYGVDINAVSFHYFQQTDQKEFLARVFLIEPSQVEYSARTKSTTKRRNLPSYAEFQEIADDNEVGELYSCLFDELDNLFDSRHRNKSSVAFVGRMNGSRNTIFVLLPGDSSAKRGLRFRVFIERMTRYLGVQKEELLEVFPSGTKDFEPWDGSPDCVAGYFGSMEDVTSFINHVESSSLKRG